MKENNFEKDYSKLNLILKDDFLEKKLFEDLHKSIVYQNWNGEENLHKTTGKHYWFLSTVFDPIKTIIVENIEKKFNIKVKRIIGDLNYSMVANVKEHQAHVDSSEKLEGFNTQFIFYVNGKNELNNGTGFYTKHNNNQYYLTTQIGFIENRALLFKNEVMHSPLKYLSEDNTPRFSIIGFLET